MEGPVLDLDQQAESCRIDVERRQDDRERGDEEADRTDRLAEVGLDVVLADQFRLFSAGITSMSAAIAPPSRLGPDAVIVGPPCSWGIAGGRSDLDRDGAVAPVREVDRACPGDERRAVWSACTRMTMRSKRRRIVTT